MALNLNGQWKAIQRQGRRLNEVHGDPVPPPDDQQSEREGDPKAAAAPEKDDEEEDAADVREDSFAQLVQRANTGDAKAIAALGKVLDEHPDIWRKVGDLAAHARLTLVRYIAGGNVLLRDSLIRKTEEMLRELSTQTASPLERLAVERLVSAWLQAQHADAMAVKDNRELPRAKYWSQCQDRAHRRFDAAMKQLTTIRELLPQAANPSPAGERELKIDELTRPADDSEPSNGALA